MTKNYKKMMDEIINKMDESTQMGFAVKFAAKKDGEIMTAWYRDRADAVKALALLKKKGLNGIISKQAIDEATPDPTQFGPDKVARAMKIAVKSDGNYTGAVKEIEKIAKDLSKVSTIARALKTANEQLEEINEGYEGTILAYLKKYVNNAHFKMRKLIVRKGAEGVVKTALQRGVADRASLIYTYELPPIVGVNEDAPANATGTAVAGTGDDNSVHTKKSELDKMKRRDPLATGYVGSVVPLSTRIKESDDNNSTMLKGVLDKIDSIEVKIDEMTQPETEITIEEKKEYKTFRDKYNA